MGVTTKGLRYPATTDPNNVSLDMQELAEDTDGLLVQAFTTAQRNAFTAAQKWTGRLIRNTTTGQYEWWDGDSWEPLAAGAQLGVIQTWTERQDFETVTELKSADATFTGAETIDCAVAEVWELTLTGNVTSIAFNNVPASGKAFALTLFLKQDATGSRTVAWPASVNWPGDTAPTLTTAAGAIDVVTLITYDGGSEWFGFVGGQNFTP